LATDMVETRPPANPLFLREEELRQGIELMFYAYRDFTFESDQQLKHYRLGRAHHRALYFIGRHPGQTVGHLLSILKVTKQSISRVLKDLLEQEYVEQKSGPRDRRERRLHLTERGKKLEQDLTDRQSQRFARAYRETGAEAVEGFRKVMLGLLDPAERAEVDKRVRNGGR
jgi:DNA-binding MarR family transcriptional regulator